MSALDDLIGATGIFTQNLRDSTSMLLGNSAKEQSVQDIIAGINEQAAIDQATISQQEGSAALKAQNNRLKIANAFGTDINAQTSVLGVLSNEAASAYSARQEALAEIERKQSTTIFDNPIEYIMNRFTINSDIAKHNAADARLTNAQNRIQELNSETDTTIKINNQLGESLTQATVDAAARTKAAAARIEAQKATFEGIKNNSQGIRDVLAANKEALANTFNVYNASAQQAHLNQSMEASDLQRQRFEFDKIKFETEQANKEDAKQFDSSLLEAVNRGRVLTGLDPLTNVAGKQAISLMKGNSPLAKQYFDLYQIGIQSAQEGRPVIATSIGNAASVLSELPVKLTPAQQPVKDLVNAATQEFIRQHGTPGTAAAKVDLKDKAAVSAGISTIGKDLVARQAANINPLDVSNIFNIGSINQLAENSPVIQSLPLYQKLLAPKVQAGIQLNDPKVVFQMVVDGISNKTISYNEALDLSTIYHVGVAVNTAARQFSALGIVPPMSYNTQVPVGKIGPGEAGFNFDFGIRNKIVDLTKPDQVSRILNEALVRQVSSYKDTQTFKKD